MNDTKHEHTGEVFDCLACGAKYCFDCAHTRNKKSDKGHEYLCCPECGSEDSR